MANAEIIVVGTSELRLLTELYNAVFRPSETEAYFRSRFQGKNNVLILVARLDGRPVGFCAGYEHSPSIHQSWLCGVLPDFRRAGIATQLIKAEHAWAADHGYTTCRFECQNSHRPMLHAAISQEYDMVGIRWDSESGDNVVLFERTLT